VYTEPCYDDFGLTGDNIIIGIWEAPELMINNTKINHKVDKALSEFEPPGSGSRVTVIEDFDNVSSHATSVALIIGSDGDGSASERGMAPDIEMHSYRSSGVAGDMELSGLKLSSHSFYQNRTWGEYVIFSEIGSERFDEVIRNDAMTTFVIAGNDFDDKKRETGTGYGSVTSPSTAKNCITVGATKNDQFDELAGFSGAGPTNDGRLKPEIVAPGYNLIVANSPDPINGTSFACPVVSGSAALVLEQWQKNHQEEMLPSTMKALLVHTANNDGNGPTFRSGYGMLDTQEAVELVVLDEYNKHKL
jgi:subtilisin family serine protease